MIGLVFGLIVAQVISYGTDAKLSCKNEKGEDIDWEILYKIPRIPSSTNRNISVGEGYAFLAIPDNAKRTDTGSWVLSGRSVEDKNSALAQTYLQVIQNRKKLAYIIYNDQEPDANSSSSTYGHMKGMLVTDGKTGFWFVHSIPKYPNEPEDQNYDYPDNAKDNGQSGLCISFNFNTLPKITNLLRYSRPNIYSKNTIPVVANLPSDVSDFFGGKAPVAKDEPWNISSSFTSINGEAFMGFAKHTKWDQELYDDAVAPNLKTSLYVETWRTGRGGNLQSDCTDKFTVFNVDEVELDFKSDDPISFPRTNDHSKWAISQQGYLPWVCIGDINRMDSQRRRGGGAVCLKSSPAWKAYKAAVSQFEGCPFPQRRNG